MKTIEERAFEKFPIIYAKYADGTDYDANERDRRFYIEVATEQFLIDTKSN